MNIEQFFLDYLPKLKKISTTPQLDIEVILGFVLKQPKSFLYSHADHSLSPQSDIMVRRLLLRRLAGEPVAYVLQQKEFYGHTFLVNQATLIPRPETELLVDETLRFAQSQSDPLIADIGTGSGNIIISLAKERPLRSGRFIASDLSQPALQVARENARRLGVHQNIQFFLGDLIQPIHHLFLTTKSLILVANLPYLPHHMQKSIQPDILFEPQEALWSERDGLGHYRRLLQQLSLFQLPLYFVFLTEMLRQQKSAFSRQCARLLPDLNVSFIDVSDTQIVLAVVSRK